MGVCISISVLCWPHNARKQLMTMMIDIGFVVGVVVTMMVVVELLLLLQVRQGVGFRAVISIFFVVHTNQL